MAAGVPAIPSLFQANKREEVEEGERMQSLLQAYLWGGKGLEW